MQPETNQLKKKIIFCNRKGVILTVKIGLYSSWTYSVSMFGVKCGIVELEQVPNETFTNKYNIFTGFRGV